LLKRFSIVLILLLTTSCSGLPNLFGGTNVAANVPVAKEVEQSVVKVVRPQTRPESINAENVEINNIQENWLLWLVALIGWILPSPSEMVRNTSHFILRLFGRDV